MWTIHTLWQKIVFVFETLLSLIWSATGYNFFPNSFLLTYLMFLEDPPAPALAPAEKPEEHTEVFRQPEEQGE